MSPVSTVRLTLLRTCYLLLVVGLATKHWPALLGDAAGMPLKDGVVVSLLSALGLLSIIGLFSPLRMLPLLLFEIAWKAIWVLAVALPNWQGGTLDEGITTTLFFCAFVIPFPFIIPWRYVARTYLASAEPVGPLRLRSQPEIGADRRSA